jgi:hypothetical protein
MIEATRIAKARSSCFGECPFQGNDLVVFVQQPAGPVNDKLEHIGHNDFSTCGRDQAAILSHQLVVTYR